MITTKSILRIPYLFIVPNAGHRYRGDLISFGNKKNHTIIVENEPLLVNNYGIIPINPKNCPTTKSLEAEKFIYWLKSKEGKSSINNFRVNGQQVFFSSQDVN